MAAPPPLQRLLALYDRTDRAITHALASRSIILLRIGLGVVFFWFGVLKFFPGLSPAQDLAARTISLITLGIVQANVSVPVLAAWECAIGLGMLTGRMMRVTILLLLMQMLGTLTPLVLFPAETFVRIPYAPTLEGQYIIKNIVLVAAALVVGATVRGGHLTAEADEPEDPAATAAGAAREPRRR